MTGTDLKVKKYWITEDYLTSKDLTSGAKLIALYLLTNSSQDKRKGYETWRCSEATTVGILGDALGYSYIQIKRNLDLLKKLKLIEEIKHGFCINTILKTEPILIQKPKEVDLEKINPWDSSIFGMVRSKSEIFDKVNSILKEKTMKPEEVIVELQKAFELSKEMPWSQDYLGFKRQLEEKMKNKGV
jgi:hypothetical protein